MRHRPMPFEMMAHLVGTGEARLRRFDPVDRAGQAPLTLQGMRARVHAPQVERVALYRATGLTLGLYKVSTFVQCERVKRLHQPVSGQLAVPMGAGRGDGHEHLVRSPEPE